MASQPVEVMVVDDEPMVGKRLEPMLARMGCAVEVFSDPYAALLRLPKKRFDIVVSDIRMDEVTGLDILETALKVSPDTRVILITGYAMMSLARDAMAKGAFDFIAKPFTPDDLRGAVTRAAQSLGLTLDASAPQGQESRA
ncbi:MAG: response regulator [Pseudomonadota bacterium]